MIKISKENDLIWQDVKKMIQNFFVFNIPVILTILIALKDGMELKSALIVGLGVLYQVLIDFIKKYVSTTKYKVE